MIKTLFRNELPLTNTIYTGVIVGCTIERIPNRSGFVVIYILLESRSKFVSKSTDYRQLSVAFPVGIKLYQCLHTNHRTSRMDEIIFDLTVVEEKQHVTEFKMYDASEWIGDILDREQKTNR